MIDHLVEPGENLRSNVAEEFGSDCRGLPVRSEWRFSGEEPIKDTAERKYVSARVQPPRQSLWSSIAGRANRRAPGHQTGLQVEVHQDGRPVFVTQMLAGLTSPWTTWRLRQRNSTALQC